MKWKIKGLIMYICSKIPYGYKIYFFLQTNFGRLDYDPNLRLTQTIESLKILKKHNFKIKNKIIFEVGTGHLPIIPTFFFLLGAKKIYSYDLNRRLNFFLFSKTLKVIYDNRKIFKKEFLPYLEDNIYENKIKILKNTYNHPKSFLEFSNIIYKAPGNAADSNLKKNSIDLHFSCTTFEHIPKKNINSIMKEAFRILKPNGLTLHRIDLSDHFAHQDKSISLINFLKFNKKFWSIIGGNQFAYCNRLRYPEYNKIFEKNNLKLIEEEKKIDEKSLKLLMSGFKIHNDFHKYSNKEICVIGYTILHIKKKI